jgi:hypothetical protein
MPAQQKNVEEEEEEVEEVEEGYRRAILAPSSRALRKMCRGSSIRRDPERLTTTP